MIGHCGIHRDQPGTAVTYIHLLLDHHAILLANGLPSESLFLGRAALGDLDRHEFLASRAAVGPTRVGAMAAARPCVSGKRLKTLLARHAKNDRPLLKAGTPPPAVTSVIFGKVSGNNVGHP